MDLNGEEKRIQALFREIKTQDDRLVSSFARTWNMMEARFGAARRPVSLRAAATLLPLIASVLVIGSLGTVIVLRPWRLLRPPMENTVASRRDVAPIAEAGVKPTSEGNISNEPKKKRNKSIALADRFNGKKLIARTNLREVKKIELSRWQSPTAGLLRFPGDELLRSGPKVIQSAQDMRTFLVDLN